jgi:spore coat protein CotF
VKGTATAITGIDTVTTKEAAVEMAALSKANVRTYRATSMTLDSPTVRKTYSRQPPRR